MGIFSYKAIIMALSVCIHMLFYMIIIMNT